MPRVHRASSKSPRTDLSDGASESHTTGEQPDFRRIQRGLKIRGPNSTPWQFSTREDYVNCLVAQGSIRDEADLCASEELVIAVQRHWHARGQNGCEFARGLSKDAPAHGWGARVWWGLPSDWPDRQWAAIGACVRAAINDPDTKAISLLFPDITTGEELVRLVRELGRLPDWWLGALPQPVQAEGRPDRVPIRLTVHLVSSKRAWPLGFGPFDFLPATRRAPFTEVALVTKPKRSPRRQGIRPKPRVAHLADIHLDEGDELVTKWDSRWEQTTSRKRTVIRGDVPPQAVEAELQLAKARVTLAIPEALWTGLRGAT